MVDSDRAGLRRKLRHARRSLTPQQRRRADAALARRLVGLWSLRKAVRVGAYLAADGEPDLAPVMARMVAGGSEVFLPVLLPGGRMRFARYRPGTALIPNCYGLPEPLVPGRDLLPARALDLVLLPLVGFDGQGNRLGMGAGFYDRALQCRAVSSLRRPLLVGVGYACQAVAALPVEPWDVPLDAVVTEAQTHRFKLPFAAAACSNLSPCPAGSD